MAVRALQHLQTSTGQRELNTKLLALTGMESWKTHRCKVLWLVSLSLKHVNYIKNAMALSRWCS